MDILVVGGGGREHALIKKIKESPKCSKVYAAPGNAGISRDAECVPIKATDLAEMVSFAKEKQIDYVVVAPEDPLALGMVDALAQVGIPAFGPSSLASRIESSKIFAKDLMKKYDIPTASYETFDNIIHALSYVEQAERFPVVVKADGLAMGKGVIIAETADEAKNAICGMMQDVKFGESGSRIVIEEFLAGPEVSVLAFADGETVIPMVSSMDHKRAFDGNCGPNTGGMGTIAPNPHYTTELAEVCMKTIFLPTIKAMKAEGCPFSGCLYFGLMLTSLGPRVIEYNCRFGDPETQVVLPLLQGDLLEIMLASTEGSLNKQEICWKDGFAACVIIASGGYPGSYKKGISITGIEEAEAESGVLVYHAGTAWQDGKTVTVGGRVLGVSATGPDLVTALEKAYRAVSEIHFEGGFYRSDIGTY